MAYLIWQYKTSLVCATDCKGKDSLQRQPLEQLTLVTEFVYTTTSKQFSNCQTYWLFVCLTGSEKRSTAESVCVDYVCKCGVCVYVCVCVCVYVCVCVF